MDLGRVAEPAFPGGRIRPTGVVTSAVKGATPTRPPPFHVWVDMGRRLQWTAQLRGFTWRTVDRLKHGHIQGA
jgi:hypothetical protein